MIEDDVCFTFLRLYGELTRSYLNKTLKILDLNLKMYLIFRQEKKNITFLSLGKGMRNFLCILFFDLKDSFFPSPAGNPVQSFTTVSALN